jgi:hypothetical protein
MTSVPCPRCRRQVEPARTESGSLQCPECFEPLQAVAPAEPTMLVLTYQKTGQRITVADAHGVVLGREGYGRELLATIPQVSRAHCQVECRDGKWWLRDVGSTHGTFAGADRTECRKEAVPIHDGDLIFLGRELFTASVVPTAAASGGELPAVERRAVRPRFECPSCGLGLEAGPADGVCPKCNQYVGA